MARGELDSIEQKATTDKGHQFCGEIVLMLVRMIRSRDRQIERLRKQIAEGTMYIDKRDFA